MTASKRRKAQPSRNRNLGEPPLRFEGQTESPANPHFREAIRQLQRADRAYSHAVGIVVQQARHARRQGHPVEAAILDRIASLMLRSGKTPDEIERDMRFAGKLMSWLPFAAEVKGLSPNQRKAWATVFIMELGLAPPSCEVLLREMTQKPGAPQSTRKLAIRAMELRREGKGWEEIARILPCDWTMVENPGNSIRRQVQFLKRTLKESGLRPGSI